MGFPCVLNSDSIVSRFDLQGAAEHGSGSQDHTGRSNLG